jgi:hypothetical protein
MTMTITPAQAEALVITPIASEKLPETAKEYFAEAGKEFCDDYTQRDPMHVEYRGINTFTVMMEGKEVAEAGEWGEVDILLIDVDDRDRRIGHGIVAMLSGDVQPFEINKPFVGETGTQPEFMRQGLGLRRLQVMNHLAQLIFRKPLHSDLLGHTSEEAKGVWRKLTEQGNAEEYTRDGFSLWRFKPSGSTYSN